MSGAFVRGAGTLALTTLAALVALLSVEGLVRLVRPQHTYRFPRGLFVEEEGIGYGLRPGFDGIMKTAEYRTHVRVNAQGLREDNDLGPKAPGAYRILALGDSFTMGVGVEAPETFVERLEASLDLASAGTRVEVVNAGVAGYGTVQSVDQLATRGLALEPDMVLLFFFVGNDVDDNARPSNVVRDGYLVDPGSAPKGMLPEPVRRWLGLHSHLYHLAWPLKARLLGGGEDRDAARRHSLARLAATPTGPGWEATDHALRRLADLAARHGLVAGVVLIPDRLQTSPELWRRAVGPEGERPDAPNAHLRRLCSSAGLPVLDLLPALSEPGAGPAYYFPEDHHLTSEGAAFVAARVAPFTESLRAAAGFRSVHAR